jgi:hypothetical protein
MTAVCSAERVAPAPTTTESDTQVARSGDRVKHAQVVVGVVATAVVTLFAAHVVMLLIELNCLG